MAAYTGTSRATPAGVNGANRVIVSFTVVTALANLDTLALTLPDGVEDDLLPLLVQVFGVSGDTYTRDADIAITSHDVGTGVTTLTASGVVAAGSVVKLVYG